MIGYLGLIWDGYRSTFDFSGRMPRLAFWKFAAFGIVLGVSLVAVLPEGYLFSPKTQSLLIYFSIATFPVWTACTRRLQDVGIGSGILRLGILLVFGGLVFFQLLQLCDRSEACARSTVGTIGGLLLLLGPAFMVFVIAPLFVFVASLILALKPSQFGPNKYGPNPHEVSQ